LTPSRNDVLVLRIESAAYEGNAVGRSNGLVVFVPFAVPGDLVRVRVTKARRRYVEAVVEEILESSADRVAPACGHFGTCGGCRLQNIAYSRQVKEKHRQVVDLLQRIGGIVDPPVLPVLAAPSPFHYRNKMEFSFSNKRWLTQEEIDQGTPLDRGFALGLHIPGRFDRVLDLRECFLHSPQTPLILNAVRDFALERGWEPYDSVKHQGFLRNLVVRWGQQTDDLMVVLVTALDLPERMAALADFIASSFPAVTTFINAVNSTRSPVAFGEIERVYFGPGKIRERLADLTIEIAPTSFFQPNTFQAEQLLKVIHRFGNFLSHHLVYDLYCGMGCIGLSLAHKVNRVIGMENWAESIRQAGVNSRANGILNCSFHHGDAAEALSPSFLQANGSPDVVVLDPPRAGLSSDLVENLMRVHPERVVYTSCNPATLARDLSLLAPQYRIEAVQPVDMFPQTHHIECVAALVRRGD